MQQASNTGGAGAPSDRRSGQRRARSASQPSVTPYPPAMASTASSRAAEPLDFSFLGQFDAGPSSAPPYNPHGFNDDAFARALQSLQDNSHPHSATPLPQAQPVPPALAPLLNPMLAQHMPNPTEAFLAALPWIQYMQMQSMYGQQQQQQQPQLPTMHQHSQQQAAQYMPPPPVPAAPSAPTFETSTQRRYESPEAGPSHSTTSQTASNSPSPTPGVEPTEEEQQAMTDEKRKRNTAASARFRIKKKLWTLNLERSISDLSGRVEELEREANELRRENGWLKEIVMLKSKRMSGQVPELEPNPSSSPSSHSDPGGSGGASPDVPPSSDKGKGRQLG